MATRQGKHAEGKVSFGIYTFQHTVDLIGFIAYRSGRTATDLVVDECLRRGMEIGVIGSDGDLRPELLDEFNLYLAVKEAAKSKRSGSKKEG